LGLTLEGDRLRFAPCLPPAWNEFAVRYRYRETYYEIVVRRAESASDDDHDAARVIIDGALQEGAFAFLVDDQQEHRIDVHVASRRPVPQMSVA
jgi:cellobiose phosphorylase